MLSVKSKTKHYDKLLHRAYEYGTIPDRNVHQFSSLSDRTRVRVLKQAYAWLVADFDMDVVTAV
jgi:hypothetical protein